MPQQGPENGDGDGQIIGELIEICASEHAIMEMITRGLQTMIDLSIVLILMMSIIYYLIRWVNDASDGNFKIPVPDSLDRFENKESILAAGVVTPIMYTFLIIFLELLIGSFFEGIGQEGMEPNYDCLFPFMVRED